MGGSDRSGGNGQEEVEISTRETRPWSQADLFEPVTSKTASGAQVIGLTAGTTYYFRVRTVTNAHTNNQNELSFLVITNAYCYPFFCWFYHDRHHFWI